MQGAPDVSDLIEHDRKIVGPMQRLQSQVYNTGAPSLAFAEIDAATLLLVWLHSEAIIKRLAAEIDTEADDEAALSHETRQQREAEVQGDLLGVERDEAALVWLRSNVCSPVEHRADISPLALLGVRLVTSPRATELRETSPGVADLVKF